MWNLSDLLIGTEPCCGFLPRCSKNQRGRGNDHHVLPTTYQMRPRLEPSKCGSFRNNSTFESCLQRTKVLWGSVFFRKWFSRYIKQFADWIGLEPCQKAAPNDQHFRGTWHFSYSQVGCAKESFSHSACHWLDIVTVPICLKMHKKYVYIYIHWIHVSHIQFLSWSLCILYLKLSTCPQTSIFVPDAPWPPQ